jgi:two-component system cell cycle response regulator DivK
MSNHKILVVEDHPLNLELVVTVLTTRGYTVRTAQDGHGLLDRVKAERPDLIIIDLQLPQIDGFTLTRQLKADPETHAFPILATSSFAKPEDQALALQAGCIAFLSKPLDLPVFLDTVARLLR